MNYFNFNACHQVQFQKNLMNKSRGKLKIEEFEPKNDQYPLFWAKHEFCSKKPPPLYGESLHIHPECGKIPTRKNSAFGHFSRNVNFIQKIRKDADMFFNIYYLTLYPKVPATPS